MPPETTHPVPRLPAAAPAAAPARVATTLGALATIQPVLDRLLICPVPATVAYRLARMARAIRPEVEHFYQKREALIRDFGSERQPTAEERAKGATTIVEVTPANLSTFNTQLTELAAVAVDLDCPRLTLADLRDVPLTGQDVLTLDPLLDITGGD